MSRTKLIAMAFLVALLGTSCSSNPDGAGNATAAGNDGAEKAETEAPKAPETAAAEEEPMPEGPLVAVLETSLGRIVIQLNEDKAPKTSANFAKLVHEGFYDGTYFHRVIPGFMIQGGDPNTKNDDPNDDGLGGPGYTVPAEIGLPHVRGAVATARTGDQVNPKKDSSGSQFFIDVAPQPSLDKGGYTVFGQVVSGMDVVDKIVALGADPSTPRGPGGPNPGKKALIEHASLESLATWKKSAGVSSSE